MELRAANPVRRALGLLAWRQWVTVVSGLAVITAMVAIAESARTAADHHKHVQVLVEQVQAASSELGVLTDLGLAGASPATSRSLSTAYVERGTEIYRDLSSTMSQLQAADHSPLTERLVQDTARLYTVGAGLAASVSTPNLLSATEQIKGRFEPLIAALGRDSAAAATEQKQVAAQASSRAGLAYIASQVIGLLLLVLVGLRLHSQRRASMLTEAHRALERRSEERVRALIEHSSDVIMVVGSDLVIRWQSSSVQRTLGQPAELLIGRRLSELVHPDDALLVESQFAATPSKPGTVTFTARFRHAAGEWRHLETIAENRLADPVVEGLVLSMRDITERKALEEELRHQAFHDALTGLANRALFEDRLAHALAGARRHGRSVAVLFLDLDDFKTINDSLGHASGDELLRAVAIRIGGLVRVTDTAARLGGDEFAILIEVLEAEDEAESIAERLLEALAPPFVVGGRELRIGASVGLAKSDGSVGVDDLLRNADTAMYAAKDAGKNTTQAFEAGMHERVLNRLELTAELQRALEVEEFELDYQPIVELDGGYIVGTEALVRWAHPSRGRLAPGQFIPLAEETGLIVPLGHWILRTACRQAASWARDFPATPPYMTVNVSTRQLHDPEFPATVAAELRNTGLAPGRLVLEITESLLPDDSLEIIAQLHKLKALGVRVAVDDFGTGYSALSRLQAYPVDILKIDRSFIDGIEHDPGKGQLVRGIVTLGESLHLEVVAEGIEEHEQAVQLRRMRSPLGQGFLFSRPVSGEQLQLLLEAGRPLTTPEAEHSRARAFV